MSGTSLDRFNSVPLNVRIRVDSICCEFEESLRAGGDPRLESFLVQLQGPHQEALFSELLSLELEYLRRSGETPRESDYAGRFGPYVTIVREVFGNGDAAEPPAGNDRGPSDARLDSTRVPGLPRVAGFELLAEIGRGGMGVVFKARQLPLRRVVALKMISAGDFARPDQFLRFVIEGEMLARLRHPNIVQVHEVGQHDGRPYLALEFVEGGTLGDYLANRTVQPRDAARLLQELARAVHYAHLQGIIHRDLKPANILLANGEGSGPGPGSLTADSPPQAPKITDFGLARSLHGDWKLTQTGLVAGTPGYMAPEQARSEKNLGPGVDIYALGAILYEMLACRPPFLADTPLATIRATLEEEAPRPSLTRSGIPADLETICLKCLEKEPNRRYLSADVLADDLQRWLVGEPITARPVKTMERLWKWSRRHPSMAGSLAAIAALIVSIAVGSVIVARRFQLIAHETGELAIQRLIDRNKALQAQEEAEQAGAEARRQEQAERWERYRANIMTALGALELNNTNIAQQALANAPEEHRNWEWRYLDSQLDRSSATLPGHPWQQGRFRGIPSSPDGNQVVLYDAKRGSLVLRDVASGKEIAALPHAALVTVLTYRPDGRQVAIGSRDGSMRLWEPRSSRPPMELPSYPTEVRALAYSADGQRLLASDALRSYQWFDALTGQQLPPLGDAQTPCRKACFAPDGQRLFAVHGKEICLWETRTPRKVAVFAGFGHEPDPMLVNSDGSRLAFQCVSEVDVHLWNVAAGKPVAAMRGHTNRVDSLAFSPDGARLATGGTYPDTTVRLWDTATGKPIAVLTGHKNGVSQLRFRSDGRRLASIADDQTARLWDGLTGQAVATLGGHTGQINQLVFSADGKRLVTAASDRTIRLWDSETGAAIAVLRGHAGSVWGVTFVAGDTLLLSAAADETYRVWDARLAERTGVLRGHTSFVYDVAFRQDGAQVASAAWDGTVRLWNPATGLQTAQLQHPDSIVGALAYSPDGKQLATVTFDNQLHIWGADSGRETHTIRLGDPEYWAVPHRPAFEHRTNLLAAPTGLGQIGLWDPSNARSRGEFATSGRHDASFRVLDLAFSPDGARLVASGTDGLIHVWDVARRVEVATLSGHSQPVYRLAFNRDGDLLASGSLDHTVRLWRAGSFQELAVLPCDSNVYGLAFIPDGTRLAVGCADNTIRMWDLARRQQVAELRGHEAYVHSLAFSPDGTQMVSASGDWTVRIWDSLKPADRIRRGHN